jgi:hypothetical protein
MICKNLRTQVDRPGCFECDFKLGHEAVRAHVNSMQIKDGITFDVDSKTCPVARSGEWDRCVYYVPDE